LIARHRDRWFCFQARPGRIFVPVSDPTENDDQPVTVIVPAPVTPSGRDDRVPSRPRSTALRVVTIALLCLALLMLVAVVVVLPELVAERTTHEREPAPMTPPATSLAPPPPADAQRLAREKREAENTLGIVLRKQTELEAEGVATWGGQDYDAALDALAAGDAQLQAGRFAEAADYYEKVGAQLDALRASMGDRLRSALQAGEAALAADDGPVARQNFEIALAIDPHSERGQQGMLRARVLEEVVALIASGSEHEAQGDFDAAKEQYTAALALDPRSARAGTAFAAVVESIRQRDFHAAMSAALTALENRDFTASRAALMRADAILPGAPEVADAGKRLQLAVQASRISAHRKDAQALERDERWQEASDRYAAVLAIDANAAFASAGTERSLAKARIHAELDAYLAALGRLSAPGPRDNARRLLDAAAGLNSKTEPKLAAKVERLAKALEIAETPMQVRLQSDNLTEVTVYKVGRFGRFASRDLQLPPGTYVAVGKRPGYRDVRVEFTLTGGQEPTDITVLCQEKI
jgi:tetratricopeptide (TPR) repeat protein